MELQLTDQSKGGSKYMRTHRKVQATDIPCTLMNTQEIPSARNPSDLSNQPQREGRAQSPLKLAYTLHSCNQVAMPEEIEGLRCKHEHSVMYNY